MAYNQNTQNPTNGHIQRDIYNDGYGEGGGIKGPLIALLIIGATVFGFAYMFSGENATRSVTPIGGETGTVEQAPATPKPAPAPAVPPATPSE